MKLTATVVLLFAFASAHAAEFSLYAIKSPVLLNWTTPSTLLNTTIRGAMTRASHQIGHVFVGFKCDGQAEVLSGMTNGKGFTSRTDLTRRGHGLSVLVQDNAGRLQLTPEVTEAIKKLAKGKRMSAMKMEISNEQCHTMKKWYFEYSTRYPIIYGGVDKRPLRGEGAGCSAYAMSFMEIADVNYDLFNRLFEMTVYLPNELLGGSLAPRKISLISIYRNHRKLADFNPNALELKLYDPNTMYLWILKKVDEIEKTGKATGLDDYDVSTGTLNKTKMLFLKNKKTAETTDLTYAI